MNINYKLKMKMGTKTYYGVMKLNINNEEASGILECGNLKTSFNNGKVEGNKIEFSGRI